MEHFEIRPYSKRELARLYFPYLENAESAVHKLRVTMTFSTRLMQQLESIHYVERCKYFTAQQVRLIVEHLGEP